ncbi:hypothetical protein GGX14DRAFT_399384 [Mycena pura]|uniref:Uncharacterized protein n=1 Tax=Mycena pura TaxID=153505 RepID=A0AAD6V4A1_9AGAR|nr:hypothetical protein GGX14DRAFT_399384 [Mycena pura]
MRARPRGGSGEERRSVRSWHRRACRSVLSAWAARARCTRAHSERKARHRQQRRQCRPVVLSARPVDVTPTANDASEGIVGGGNRAGIGIASASRGHRQVSVARRQCAASVRAGHRARGPGVRGQGEGGSTRARAGTAWGSKRGRAREAPHAVVQASLHKYAAGVARPVGVALRGERRVGEQGMSMRAVDGRQRTAVAVSRVWFVTRRATALAERARETERGARSDRERRQLVAAASKLGGSTGAGVGSATAGQRECPAGNGESGGAAACDLGDSDRKGPVRACAGDGSESGTRSNGAHANGEGGTESAHAEAAKLLGIFGKAGKELE